MKALSLLLPLSPPSTPHPPPPPITSPPPSPEQPGGVRAGHQRLQDAGANQMPQLPVRDHAEVLECQAGRAAGLQDPQSPTRQQFLRAGVTAPCSTPKRPPRGSRESDSEQERQKRSWIFYPHGPKVLAGCKIILLTSCDDDF